MDIFNAIEYGDIERVRVLLDYGKDVDSTDFFNNHIL